MRFINRVLLLVAGLVLIGVLQQQGASNAFAATTYYIDSLYGNDANSGTTEAQPWQTLAPVNSRMASACSPCAQPGDTFHFKAGSVLTGTTLTLERSGTAASRIRFDKYGTGNDPDFLLSTYDPGPDPRPCVEVFADYITLANMRIRSCFAHWGGPIFDGVKVRGDYFLLDQVTVQNNMAGINITGLASNGRITNSVIFGNTYGDGSGSSGDGILLHGSNNEIDHNTIQQNHWTDGSGCLHGASIEVYGDNGEHADQHHDEQDGGCDSADERNADVHDRTW